MISPSDFFIDIERVLINLLLGQGSLLSSVGETILVLVIFVIALEAELLCIYNIILALFAFRFIF